jgi:hypothetical protein
MSHTEKHTIEEEIERLESIRDSLPATMRPPIQAQINALKESLSKLEEENQEALGDLIENPTASEATDVYIIDPSCGLPKPKEEALNTCPPPCVPSETCSPIDWLTLPDRQPIFSEEACQYWVSILTPYLDVKTLKISEIVDEFTDEGIKLILEFAGKSNLDFDVAEVRKGIITDSFVDFRKLAGIKVLIRAPLQIVSLTPNKQPVQDPSPPESSEQRLTVTLTNEDLRGAGSMFSLVKKAIKRKYSVQYEKLNYEQKISGLPASTSLILEADRLEDFRKSLVELLKNQGFKFNPTRRKSGVLEAVEIEFKENFAGVKRIRANNIGCEAKELGLNDAGGPGWNSFLEKSSTNYPTTLAFVSVVPSIFNDVTSDNPPPVDQFLQKYFYPPLEQTTGQDLVMAGEIQSQNDCNIAKVASNLARPALYFGSEVAGTALSLPELIASTIPDKACLTAEGKIRQDEKFNLNIRQRMQDVRNRKFLNADNVFENLPSTLAEIQNIDDLYKNILDKLGVCGLSALALDSLGCIMKGLDIELSTEMLVKSFIKNATEKELESLFFKLNPALQQFVRDSVSKITTIPLPWEAGYQPGSYSSAGVRYSADYVSSLGEVTGTGSLERRLEKTGFYDENQEEEQITSQYDSSGNLRNFRVRSKTTIKEQEEKFKSFADVSLTDKDGNPVLDEDGNPIILTSPQGVIPAPGLGPRRFAGPFAAAGSVGTALDSIQDNAIDILREALIKEIESGIISAKEIMGFLDKIPGANLIKSTITETLDCPMPPLFSPPLDDILKTLELDFCGGHYAITLPVMRKINVRPIFGDIKTVILEAAEEAIENLVVKSMVTILEKLLSFSINATCEVLKDAAGIMKDIAGGSDFRAIVSNNICGDSLNDAALNASLKDLNKALGSFNLPGVPLPTDDDMGNLMDGVSAILTQEELLDLLDGEPNQRAVSYVKQVVKGIPNLSAALPTDDNIKNLFRGLGRVFDRDAIRDRIKATAFRPISPSVCASPEHLEIFDSIRCSILQEKGMSEEQCEEQLQKLKDQALCDFDSISDVINENYFGKDSLVGSDTCPTEGIYPAEDPTTKKITKEMFDSNYQVINSTFMEELLTRRGLLNMILSDQRGAGFKKHNEFWVQNFGAPLSEDFGLFGFYADEDNGKPTPFGLDSLLFGGEPLGTYPTTVALYLQETLASNLSAKYENITPNITLNYEHWDTDDDFDNLEIDFNYQLDNDTIINIDIASNDDVIGAPRSYDVIKSYDDDILNKISSLGAASPQSPNKPTNLRNQPYVFANLVANEWSKYTTSQQEIIKDEYKSVEFDYITTCCLRKFANKISQNSRTFIFGYNSESKPEIKKLDYKEYGGTEGNPAFYVEPPKHAGWLGLYDKLIPEADGCTRESILNFNSISSQTQEYYDTLKEDQRSQIPEECIINSEKPFDRVMSRASLAGTDGTIMATVRLYVIESFIRGMSSFSMFAPKFPEVYDDTLLSYISRNIQEGLLNTGINFRSARSKENYYYNFLEQVVQNFGKRVDAGMINPTQAQINAMETINNRQQMWTTKKFKTKKLERKVKNAFIKTVEPECLLLLNYYISQQAEEVGELFSQELGPAIPNLESWIFGSQTWMKVGYLTGGGPIDVAVDPLDINDPTVQTIDAVGSGGILSFEDPVRGFFPFILEKYIKVEENNDSVASSVSSASLPQIYNLKELKENVKSAGIEGKTVDSTLKKWSYGIRISMMMSGETKSKLDSSLFSSSISDEEARRVRSLKMGTKFAVPVCEAEIPISGTKTIQDSIFDSEYDINCMITELINTPNYKTLFNYCFPLQTLLSLVTIYTMETFLLSIGSEWLDKDANPQPGGAQLSQFRRWDKQGNFVKTRKNLRRLFESYYNSRDAAYENEETETQEERTRRNLKVKRKLPKSKDLKWWQRRLQVPKPAALCEEEGE